eukprot:scaffold1669_cov129-Cylindrotheca_fusiformis.AAC.40
MHLASNKVCALVSLFALLGTATSLLTSSRNMAHRAVKKSKVSLMSWSLHFPDDFGTFKSTWYNEVQNPTARKTVYEDVPTEFQFVSVGSDWPSFNDVDNDTSVNTEKKGPSRICINPIRRARQWVAYRRKNADSSEGL